MFWQASQKLLFNYYVSWFLVTTRDTDSTIDAILRDLNIGIDSDVVVATSPLPNDATAWKYAQKYWNKWASLFMEIQLSRIHVKAFLDKFVFFIISEKIKRNIFFYFLFLCGENRVKLTHFRIFLLKLAGLLIVAFDCTFLCRMKFC